MPNYTVYVDRFTNVTWITVALSTLVLAVTFYIVSQGREFNVFSIPTTLISIEVAGLSGQHMPVS